MLKRIKKLISAVAVVALSLLFSLSAFATSPYASYNYDSNGEIVDSVDIYETLTVISGESLGIGDFSAPSDIYVTNGVMYLLDSGNNRIVEVNLDSMTAETVTVKNGETEVALAKDSSIYIDGSDTVFITDSGNQCVWICDDKGNVTDKITKPASEFFDDSLEFLPKKIIGDSVGNIYVQCTGVFEGLAIFNKYRVFSGFFGSEKVETTSSLLRSYFWKQFMTAEQKATMENYVPDEIYSMDISEKNFVYTITPGSLAGDVKVSADTIRCLNPKGSDILENFMSKEVEISFNNENRYLNFVDIAYSDSGFINVLDNRQGRVYQFDKNMQLVSAFAGLGSYKGTFAGPSAIEVNGEDILVLDSLKNNVTLFTPTETGKTVHKALTLYNKGDYTESMEPWLEVTKKYPNFQLAYIGIGNALFNEGEYAKALEYYELAKDTEGWSKAYKEYRVVAMRDNAVWIALAIVILIVAIKLVGRFAKGKIPTMQSLYQSNGAGIMFYSVFHPFNGFDRIRTRKIHSYGFCAIVFAALVLLGVAEQQYMGKAFSMTDSAEVNIIGITAVRAAVLILFTVSNWAISVLLDGKATFSEICHFTSIVLVPYIICSAIRVVLSHFLVENESIFMTLAVVFGVIWALMLLMSAFSAFHEFELGKGVAILIFTIIGMALIVILGFLIYNLAQNVIDFVRTVFSEAVFRMNV